MTDYLLPSGAKCSESLGNKKHCQEMLCYAAGLQDRLPAGTEPVWGGTGSRWEGGLSWAPETWHMDVTSGLASSAWPTVPWVCGSEKQPTETENRTWIAITSKKPVVIVVSSVSPELPAEKDVLSIAACYAHCKAREGLIHPDSSVLPVF